MRARARVVVFIVMVQVVVVVVAVVARRGFSRWGVVAGIALGRDEVDAEEGEQAAGAEAQ